jgi:hypothetical protein
MLVGLRRWSDEPEPSGEHEVVGIQVELPPAADPDDDRFSLFFQTATGRTLRVRLPVAHMEALARCLLDAAEERGGWRATDGV